MASIVAEQEPLPSRGWCGMKALENKLTTSVIDTMHTLKKLGQDDPRKIVHSLKVGLAISVVSLIYYFEPLFEGFGVAAMWAVMTVIVVFEFSVGATLGKGVNRGVATFLGCGLGVGAHRLASLAGDKLEPLVLGLSVFVIAAIATFVRFLPKMKARYDYGLLIFILTFSLVSVSAYRDDKMLQMAQQRLSTVLIGGSVSLLICVFICPVWAGYDLHNLVSYNIEMLGIFLEGYGAEYLKGTNSAQPDNVKTSLLAYKSVLGSKATEESLVNFAKWEPRHGRIRYRQPWGQYLKIGALTRQCAYTIEALNVYLNAAVRAPEEVRESCIKMSIETSKALKELSWTIKTMTWSSSALSHVANAKLASEDLTSKSGLWQDVSFLTVIPAATAASLLTDIVNCTEKIAEAVQELALVARFSNQNALNLKPALLVRQETSMRGPAIEEAHRSVVVE